MEKLTFTFTIDHANIVLSALGKQPYEVVAPVIESIQKEAAIQMAPKPPVEE
jgi:hypothetical protein